MKYTLFRDIDSISDEQMLHKLIALVKGMLVVPQVKAASRDEMGEIPEFIQVMSVGTGLSGNIDVKDLMHEHWTEAYG